MRAKDIAEEHDVGFVISYEPDENRLTLLSGSVYGEIVGGSVSEPRSREEDFRGDLSDQDGTVTFLASPDWDPEEGVREDVLVVQDAEKMKFQKLPDHQPDRPLSLFVSNQLVSQGKWEVSYPDQGGIKTGLLGFPRPLFTATGMEPFVKEALGISSHVGSSWGVVK